MYRYEPTTIIESLGAHGIAIIKKLALMVKIYRRNIYYTKIVLLLLRRSKFTYNRGQFSISDVESWISIVAALSIYSNRPQSV